MLKLRRISFKPPADNVSTGRITRPDYIGAAKPEVLFVVDPIVGGADDDEAPKPTRPISKSQLEFLSDFCKKHEIPIERSAITWACTPIVSEVWDSDKRRNDHIKLHRETFVDTVKAASPKIIVAMGKSSATAVLGRPAQITKIRGMPERNEEFDCLVFPTLGVGHVIRIPENERMFDADFGTLSKIIKSKFKLDYQSKIEQDYKWATNVDDLLARADAGEKLELSVDIESVGLRYYDPASRILCVQIADRPGRAIALPIDYNHTKHRAPASRALRASIIAQLKRLLQHKNVSCFGQNFKFDYLFLKHKLEITVRDWTDDTICLMHGVDENMRDKSLDEITRQYIPSMQGYADKFNKDPVHLKKTRMDLVPPDQMLMYGCGDVDATYRCKNTLEAELKKDPKGYNCYKLVVMPALRAFGKIEHHGFRIDKKALKAFEKMLRKHQDTEYKAIRAMVPKVIADAELTPHQKIDKATGVIIKHASLTRPGFLRAMLFTHPRGLRLTPRVFTPSTAKLKDKKARVPSTSGKMHLAYFENEHEFITRIMEYIKNEKLLGTYVGTEDVEDGEGVKGFYKYLFDGFIRPSYLLHRTVTGRSASSDPNGQNFPKRGKLAKKYREIFVAGPGEVLLEVDFSQLELRIAAIMANDPVMLRLYREGADIHAATAAAVMKISLAEFNKLPKAVRDQKRFQAKAVNFGFLYGMGWRKFMNYARTDYGITFSEEEAQEIRETFFNLYKNLRTWHNSVRYYVKEKGYVRAYDGRVRHLPSVFSPDEMIASSAERQAINSPVQGFGSDLGLMALALLVKNVPEGKVRIVGFIHDAIVAVAKEENALEAARLIKYWMEHIPLEKWFKFQSPIPIIAEASIGKNLANMIELSNADLADDNVSTWKQISGRSIARYEAKLREAIAAGVPTKDLPKHPLGNQPLPVPRKRLVLRRKLLHINHAHSKPKIQTPRRLILKRKQL
jgi:DNA polymerase I-like protein with 3'-5' exonuclease and polymerase domains